MPTKRIWLLLTILGFGLTIGSIVGIKLGDAALKNPDRMVVTTPTGEKLVGKLYLGAEPAGVILLEGFGSDQVTMQSAANEFARMGVNVFTFDFSGHGRSPGGLDLDNAQTDRLARQVLAAKEHFMRVANLEADQIILFGHSLGARVALQAATMGPDPPAGLILLGTQVNLMTNVQAEVFTGVSDADLEWVQALDRNNPDTKILLISGTWDDILTPAAAEALTHKLGGQNLWTRIVGSTLWEANSRELVILPQLLHNYEPFSPRALSLSKMWAGLVWELDEFSALTSAAQWRVILWITGFAGMLMGVSAGGGWANQQKIESETHDGPVTISNLRRFLWGKLALWVAALPLMGVVGSIIFFLPLNLPAFNLIYVGFLGGYGILLWILYRWDKMPGVSGRLPFEKGDNRAMIPPIWPVLSVGIGLLILTAAYGRTGWFFVYPLNERFWWLLIFTPVTALGFWIGLHEMKLVERAAPGKFWPKLAVALIGLIPFFLWTGFLAAIGSLSGLTGGVQGLLILWLVLVSGNLIQKIGQRPWLTAFIQAVLLYWLILPQGVLFR